MNKVVPLASDGLRSISLLVAKVKNATDRGFASSSDVSGPIANCFMFSETRQFDNKGFVGATDEWITNLFGLGLNGITIVYDPTTTGLGVPNLNLVTTFRDGRCSRWVASIAKDRTTGAPLTVYKECASSKLLNRDNYDPDNITEAAICLYTAINRLDSIIGYVTKQRPFAEVLSSLFYGNLLLGERKRSHIAHLASQLPVLRKLLDLSTTQMAHLVGMDASDYMNIESGKRAMTFHDYLAFIAVFIINPKTNSYIQKNKRFARTIAMFASAESVKESSKGKASAFVNVRMPEANADLLSAVFTIYDIMSRINWKVLYGVSIPGFEGYDAVLKSVKKAVLRAYCCALNNM